MEKLWKRLGFQGASWWTCQNLSSLVIQVGIFCTGYCQCQQCPHKLSTRVLQTGLGNWGTTFFSLSFSPWSPAPTWWRFVALSATHLQAQHSCKSVLVFALLVILFNACFPW